MTRPARAGAPVLLSSLASLSPWMRHLCAEGAYCGPKFERALAKFGEWTVEVLKLSDAAEGFEVIPRRWVVERTFAWLGRNRRLAKDFERRVETAVAWILVAHIKLLTRRLARV